MPMSRSCVRNVLFFQPSPRLIQQFKDYEPSNNKPLAEMYMTKYDKLKKQ